MLNVILTLIVLLVLSEGTGQWLLNRLHIDNNSYAAPAGTAGIFTVLELLYLPILLLHLSSSWTRIVTTVVFAATIIVTLIHIKDTLKKLIRPRSLYILAAGAFTILLILRYNGIALDHMELQLMKANAATASSQLGSLRLQGYELLGAMVLYFGNINTADLGLILMLYCSCVGFMLVLDIIDSFELKNPWFRFTLIVFFIFYEGFNQWRLSEGFSGDAWRLNFIALSLFTAYIWLKSGKEEPKKLIPFIQMAGLFVSDGYLMISIEIVYCLLVYLLHIQKIRALYDSITFFFPVAIYLSCWLGQYSKAAGWLFFLLYGTFMVFRHFKKVYRTLIKVENFLIAYNIRIFYITIPTAFLIDTFILRFFVPGYGIQYKYYITYFSHHYVNGFLFPKGNLIDIVVDIFRWAGVVVFLITSRTKPDRMIKNVFLCMLVFFINPLCMGMLLEITGLEMYACAFEILFNPFTEILVFIAIYRLFEWTVIGQWVLELVLVFAALFGHITSYAGMNMGLYTHMIQSSETSEVTVNECL